MKICLATIHVKPAFIPLSLLYLKAYLVQQHGYDDSSIDILEFPRDIDGEEVVRKILQTSPAILGLSCYVWNIKTLMAVSRKLKDLRPEMKIVLGGPEVGPVSTSVLEMHPYIDVVVKSEGEVPFAQIVDKWRHHSNIAEIAGISFRSGDKVIENRDAPYCRISITLLLLICRRTHRIAGV